SVPDRGGGAQPPDRRRRARRPRRPRDGDRGLRDGGERMSSAVGFRAHLSGVSLWDLVQMECLARAQRGVQVIGDGGVGYLFLADGRVVHAQTPRLAGQAAALEILGWRNGSFHQCERPWPRAATIETSCEALILQAARRRDELGGSNLVAF